MIVIIILCLIIIGYLGYRLYHKDILDKEELTSYQNEVMLVKEQCRNLNKELTTLHSQYEYE